MEDESIRTIEEMRVLFKQRGYNLLSDEYVGNKSPLVFEKDGYKYQNTYQYRETLKAFTAKI